MTITATNLPVIGAICGDILGSRYEFRSVKQLDHKLCRSYDRFTDDTVCSIAIADSIVNNISYADALRKWCRKYPRAGYGRAFKNWIKGDCNPPYNSWGNGSAMRVSAVGALAKTLDEALELAARSAEVTHNHPEGVKGAQATAAAIYLARNGKSKDEIRQYIESTFAYDLNRKYSDIQPGYKFDVSCQGSVPESIICFLESEDYEDTVRHAIAMGGDADTMAAIAGSIAAAYYKEIPDNILNFCVKKLPDDIQTILKQL